MIDENSFGASDTALRRLADQMREVDAAELRLRASQPQAATFATIGDAVPALDDVIIFDEVDDEQWLQERDDYEANY